MSAKKIIDYLSILFVLLFIFFSVLISFYAAGYRFNLKWPINNEFFLIKTGMLVLDTEPRRANITLKKDTAGLFQKGLYEDLSSPVKLQNLLPGKYELSIEKENYWPIKRDIKILANQVTNLGSIFLFKKTLPLPVYYYKHENEDLIFNYEEKLILFNQNGLVLNLNNGNLIQLENFKPNQNYQWLKQDNKLLLNNKLYNLENGNLISEFEHNDKKIFYDERTNRLFYLNNNKIKYYLLDKNLEFTLLNTEDYQDFIIYGNNIHVLISNNNRIYLKTFLISSGILQRTIILPNGNYSFFDKNNEILNIYDEKQKRLILLDNSPFLSQYKIFENITNWKWIDKQELILRNTKEIYHYNISTDEKKLLIRLSENITGQAWHRNRNYLIFSTYNYIKIAYFRENNIDTFNLVSLNNIHSLLLDQESNTLYFYAEIANQSGFYKLNIE